VASCLILWIPGSDSPRSVLPDLYYILYTGAITVFNVLLFKLINDYFSPQTLVHEIPDPDFDDLSNSSVITAAGVFILELMGQVGTADTDMKNLPYGIAVVFNLLLALGTLPIFLNLKSWFKDHMLRSALSFFLLPLVIMIYLVWSMEEEAWTGVAFCAPYFIVLSVLFVRFRNQTLIE
jgi:hypothetical protein